MWQLFALASLFATSGESVIDKVALVTDRRIDSTVATFWRLVFFFLATLAIGWLGFLGGVQFIFVPLIFLLAAIGICNSLFYTYLLRRVEITGIGAITYLSPFLFLFIDTRVLHTALSATEITGIILMVLGGFSFAIDGKTHHFKKELSPAVWFMLLFSVFYTGVEAYAFKYLHAAYGTSAIGFTASYGVLMLLGLFALVIVRGKSKYLFSKPAVVYLPRVLISKAFDATGSILWAQALTLAAVSQVSAMEALEPLVLFGLTVLVQDILRFRAEEKLGRKRLKWKATAIALLVLGGVLVS